MFEKILEKKTFILNCDVCDARKVKEEDLSAYEQIVINADVLLVSEESKSVLNRLPAVCNADTTLELDGDFRLISYNGEYEINGSTPVFPHTILTVNGNLRIHPGTEEILKSFLYISVNGSVQCPKSLSPFLSALHVNGSMECYPDGCIVLDSVFVPDAWFALRARENGSYFVSQQVRLTDPKVDLAALTAKKVRFFTPSLLVPEEKAAAALPLVDETVSLEVIPSGYSFADGDFSLDESFLSKYGNRVYVSGSLELTKESEAFLPRLEGLIVRGTVSLPDSLQEGFLRLPAEYGALSVVKPGAKQLRNKVMVTLDNAMLDASPDGILIANCAAVRIKKDVEPQRILDLASFANCAKIFCTPEQKSAAELVSQNVAFIGSDSENEGSGGLMDMVKQLARCKIVNADQYVL